MTVPIKGQYRDVPLQLVDDPQLPSRTEMDELKLEELTTSIRANGIINPITLVQRDDRYEVVAGHRRTIAARHAGLFAVPAIVYPPDHPALRAIQAHENAKREDLNPVDEAYWFAELLERDCGNDVDKLAGLVGERRSYVEQRLELLELDEDTREALRLGKIKIGVARELLKVTDLHYRRYYLDAAVRSGGATIAVVSGWVAEWKNNSALNGDHPQRPAPAIQIPAGPAYDAHRCYICGKTDPRYVPETLPVHTHCRLAILDELLQRAANQESLELQASDPRRT